MVNLRPESTPGEPEPRLQVDLARLNKAAEAQSKDFAAGLRSTTIKLAYETFAALLAADTETEQLLEQSGYPEGKNPQTYLMLDMLASKSRDADDLPTALTYLLVREETDPSPGEIDFDRIHLFLPVPDDFILGSSPSELPPLDEQRGIWVELEKYLPGGDRRVRRFEITRDAVTEYSALGDPASELVNDQIEFRSAMDEMAAYQRLGQAMLAQLLEDHRNFKIVPQPYDGPTA